MCHTHMKSLLLFYLQITASCILTAGVVVLWFHSSTSAVCVSLCLCVSASERKCHTSCTMMNTKVTATFLLSLCLSSSSHKCTQAQLQSTCTKDTHTQPLSSRLVWEDNRVIRLPKDNFSAQFWSKNHTAIVSHEPRASSQTFFFFFF